MKHRITITLLLLLSSPHHAVAQSNPSRPPFASRKAGDPGQPESKETTSGSIPSTLVLDDDVKFPPYEARTYMTGDEAHPLRALEILKAGRTIFTRTDSKGTRYKIGCFNSDDAGNADIPPGKKITGTGKSNLVISGWTGGAHCCFSYSIFELDDTAREVGKINAGDGDICRFRTERSGKVDFIVSDWTFAYWNTSFGQSPAPDVILRYQPGGYQVATDFMATPKPAHAEFEKQVHHGRLIPLNDQGVPADSSFWKVMLDGIYTGHADLAWKFCERAWPGSTASKENFLESFKALLSQSPYWKSIKAMNGM